MLINYEDIGINKIPSSGNYATGAITMSNYVLPCMKHKSYGHIFFVSFSDDEANESKFIIDEFIRQNQYALQNAGIKFTVIDPAKKSLL